MDTLTTLTKRWRSEQLMLPIWWEEGNLYLLDQRAFPFKKEVIHVSSLGILESAIRTMQIRGSGAIGLCGAYGLYLASRDEECTLSSLSEVAQVLISTRPTAINLSKTIHEILKFCEKSDLSLQEAIEQIVVIVLERQLTFERTLGAYGASLIDDGDSVLTHCHSGAYAGSGYGGRALSVIRAAWDMGKKIHVYVSETRPYLQGARITAFELGQLGIPCTLITDSSAAFLMQQGKIQKIVVGSDRVAGNGDLVNKIGTYMHALSANYHGIPFYTATSSHTIDFTLQDGLGCPIEYRDANEVKQIRGVPIALDETKAIYPSFDITPNVLIHGIITEKGVILAPYTKNLQVLKQEN